MNMNSVEEHGFMTQINEKQSLPNGRPASTKMPFESDMDRRIKDVMVADNDIKLDGYRLRNIVWLPILGTTLLIAGVLWHFEFLPNLKENPTHFTQIASLNTTGLTSFQESGRQESGRQESGRQVTTKQEPIKQDTTIQKVVKASPISASTNNTPPAPANAPIAVQTVNPILPVTAAPQLNLAQKLAEKPEKLMTPENREQAQSNIARAERIIAETKDISAARLFLERALQLGEPKAALLLGETYDPARLTKLGVKGIKGDIQRAKELYEQAFAGGVVDAKARLDTLR
jgi:hypothetical protein